MDCYVYYRVSSLQTDAARQAVTRLFALTTERFGISGRIQWRADASTHDVASGTTTWMEHYAVADDVGAAFLAALPQMAAECGLRELLDGERHVECFVDLPISCA